jgi:hypothetical protein
MAPADDSEADLSHSSLSMTAPANDSEAEKADDDNGEFNSEPEQELSPGDELGMYTCLCG